MGRPRDHFDCDWIFQPNSFAIIRTYRFLALSVSAGSIGCFVAGLSTEAVSTILTRISSPTRRRFGPIHWRCSSLARPPTCRDNRSPRSCATQSTIAVRTPRSPTPARQSFLPFSVTLNARIELRSYRSCGVHNCWKSDRRSKPQSPACRRPQRLKPAPKIRPYRSGKPLRHPKSNATPDIAAAH
jgi:hypothetical protein